MQLLFTTTSPFARKVHMSLIVTGLIKQCELIVANPFESESLRKANPLGKVPALIDDQKTIIESGLICEYLDSKQNNISLFRRNSQDYYKVQNIHFQADGILDAAVSAVFEQRRDTEHSQYWLDRWHTAITQSVQNIDPEHLGEPQTPHIGTLATASALGYLDFRMSDLNWRSLNDKLSAWFEPIESTDWFKQTDPDR